MTITTDSTFMNLHYSHSDEIYTLNLPELDLEYTIRVDSITK